jgi:hypothetical protein
MEVCQKHALPMKTLPPGRSPPTAGTLVAGHPFDPVLAAVYKRIGGAVFGEEYNEELFLNPVNDQLNGIARETEDLRREYEPFRSSVIFGSIPGLAYYYAVIPKLADAQGRQPVIYFDAYITRYVLPIASDVDRFFDTLSRYLEILVEDESYRLTGTRGVRFPTQVPELIARDRRLVEMIVTGRFDFIMNLGSEFQEWLDRVKRP